MQRSKICRRAADGNNNVVREIPATGGAIQTFGSGFTNLGGGAGDGNGRLYVIDTNAAWLLQP